MVFVHRVAIARRFESCRRRWRTGVAHQDFPIGIVATVEFFIRVMIGAQRGSFEGESCENAA